MTTFNAGAIEANLTLGRSNWVRDLKKTQKEIRDLENKSVTIGVDLDTDNAQVAMDNLEMFLEDFDSKTYTPSVDLITREAEQALYALERRLDRMDDRNVTVLIDADYSRAETGFLMVTNMADALENDTVNVNIDADYSKAETGFVMVTAMADALDGDTINLDIDVDDWATAHAQLTVLERQVEALDGHTIDIDVDMDAAALKALTGPAGSDGGGGHLGLLKILMYAILALSPVLAVSMGSVTATVVAFTAAVAGAAGATLVLAGGLVGLVQRFKETDPSQYTPAMQAFADSIDHIKEALDVFLDGIEDTGFTLMAAGVELAADILPTLIPIFNAVAEALGGVVEGIGKFVDSPEYQEMIAFFSRFGADMLVSFLNIGGNLLQFFGRLFQAIAPFATQMMTGLEDVTQGWADWADDLENNEAFQHFVDNALKYGPMVLDMLGSLLQAFISIGHALEPFAGPMLEGLIFFFDLIANADPDMLTAIIGGLAGLWLGLNVIGPAAMAASGGLATLGAALGIGLGPIILIVAAIAGLVATIWYLWETNEEFRTAVIDTWNSIYEAIEPIVTDIVALIMDNWGPIKDWAMGIWEDIQSVVVDAMIIIRQVVGAATAYISWIWKHFGDDILNHIRIVARMIGGVIQGLFTTLKGIFQVIKGVLTGDWDAVWEGIKNITRGSVQTVISVIRGILEACLNIVGGVQSAFNAMIDFFRKLPGRVGSAVSGLFDGIRDNFMDVINDIIRAWNNLHFSVDIPDKIPGLPDSFTIDTPDVPTLAKGAYLTEATLAIAGEAGPEIVAPEPVLERIVRDNSGANLDYGRLAAAVAAAIAAVWEKMGGVSREDLERLIEAASVNIDIDARSDAGAAGALAKAIGFELRLLGYGGKANV